MSRSMKGKGKSKRSGTRGYRMSEHRRHHKRRQDLLTIAGVAIGEYLTLSAGTGEPETAMQTIQNPKELVRQQLVGLTGYDIDTKEFYGGNLIRFWGPIVGMKVLSVVIKKVNGGRGFEISKDFRIG